MKDSDVSVSNSRSLNNERDDLYSITYISRCRIPPWEFEAEVEDIEKASIRNNEASAITGKLICRRGHFVQRLEGPRQKVEETMDVIRHDPRHDNITVLSAHRITRRMYDDWQQMHMVTDGPEVNDLDAVLGPLCCRAVQSTNDDEAAAMFVALQNNPTSGRFLLPEKSVNQ